MCGCGLTRTASTTESTRPGVESRRRWRTGTEVTRPQAHGLLVPKPTGDADCQAGSMPDLRSIVHWRPVTAIVTHLVTLPWRMLGRAWSLHLLIRRDLRTCSRSAGMALTCWDAAQIAWASSAVTWGCAMRTYRHKTRRHGHGASHSIAGLTRLQVGSTGSC